MIPSFRVWDTNTKQMHYLVEGPEESLMIEYFQNGWQLICIDTSGPRIVCGQTDRRDDGVLMMSSELRDVRGNEIYRCDIVTMTGGFKAEVLYDNGAFVLDGSQLEVSDPNLGDMLELGIAHLEVIGNTFTSPTPAEVTS